MLLAVLWVVLFAIAVALYKNGKAPSWDIGILRTLTWVVVGSGILVLVRWRQARSQPPEPPSNVSAGPGWWVASDGKWYAPELHPDYVAPPPPPPAPQSSPVFLTIPTAPLVEPTGWNREPFGLSLLKRLRLLPPEYTREQWRTSQQGRFKGPSGVAEAACGLAGAGLAITAILHLVGPWVLIPSFVLIVLFLTLAKRNLRVRQQRGPTNDHP